MLTNLHPRSHHQIVSYLYLSSFPPLVSSGKQHFHWFFFFFFFQGLIFVWYLIAVWAEVLLGAYIHRWYLEFGGVGSAEGSDSKVSQVANSLSQHQIRIGNEEEGGEGTHLSRACLLYASDCADSFTYIVFWDRCCSHLTDGRLWEV